VTPRARWVTLRARWVTLRARWVTPRARWVTLRARWVTLRARWVTLRARWVTFRCVRLRGHRTREGASETQGWRVCCAPGPAATSQPEALSAGAAAAAVCAAGLPLTHRSPTLAQSPAFESRHLEIRAQAAARLVLEVPAGWVSPSSRGLWGGDALLLSTDAAEETPALRLAASLP
jgi:hypothetical protein